ncbi:MAG: Sec-independent protein translocase protein TatB [Steroidobacteraceae bacterium]
MFDIGFSEVLLIFVIALVVLGPEKLPRLAGQVGRWIGRARAMARQFKEQLEEEVNLEQVRKAQETKPSKPASPTESESPPGQAQEPSQRAATSFTGPDPADFRADTFSHAHPTNEYGANPLTPDGAPAAAEPLSSDMARPASDAPPPSATVIAASQGEASTNEPPRGADAEAYAAAAAATPAPQGSPATLSDNHGLS